MNELEQLERMKLHEIVTIHLSKKSYIQIMKVPSGWIYTNYTNINPTSVFVPDVLNYEVKQT